MKDETIIFKHSGAGTGFYGGIIWYGVQNTVKSFSKWNRCGMQRNVTRIGGRVSLSDFGYGGNAGSHSSACGLSPTVLYF